MDLRDEKTGRATDDFMMSNWVFGTDMTPLRKRGELDGELTALLELRLGCWEDLACKATERKRS